MEENNSAQGAQEPQPQFVPHTFIAQNVPEQNQTTGNKPKTNYLLIILVIVFVNIAIIGALAFLIMPSKNAKNKTLQTITSNINNPLPENSASNNSQTISNLTESTIAPSPKPAASTSSDYIPTLIETTHGSIKINLSKEWNKQQISSERAKALEDSVGPSTSFEKDKSVVLLISINDFRKDNRLSYWLSKDLNLKEVQMEYLKEAEDNFRKDENDREVKSEVTSQYSERFGVSTLEITEKRKSKSKITGAEYFVIGKMIIFIKNYRSYTLSFGTSEDKFDKEWGEFEKNSLNTIEFIN
ncbi:MAG: hypothetical protein Q7K55_01780 [Candidatus Levybacteria bacterium]|nr:hypothetical protein [Candidatus Levybacteria bacterium]